MLKTLEQLAMPSRADIVSIAERMTNIEMRLDDMDAKLDEMRKADCEIRGCSRVANAPQATHQAAEPSAAAASKKTGRSRQAKRGKK